VKGCTSYGGRGNGGRCDASGTGGIAGGGGASRPLHALPFDVIDLSTVDDALAIRSKAGGVEKGDGHASQARHG